MKHSVFWCIVIIFIFLGTLKYFYNFSHRAFLEADQEYLALAAKQILVDRKITLIGAPTSVGGMFIGPLYNYFEALAFWVGKMNPYTVDFVSSLWGIITIICLFLVGKKLFGLKAGFFSALIALVSVEFLKTEALPPLLFPLPLISLLIFYLINLKQVNWLLVGLLVGLSLNFHFTGLFFIPVIFFCVLLKRPRKIKIDKIFLLFFPLAILVFPLFLFEIRHNLFISRNFLTFILQRDSNTTFNFLSQLFQSVRVSFEGMAGMLYPKRLPFTGIILPFIIIAFAGILCRYKKIFWIALSWIFIPIFLFAFYKGNIINYYFIISIPVFFLLFGIVFAEIFLTFPGKIVIAGMMLFLFYNSTNYWINWRSAHALFYKMQAYDFIKEKAGNKPFYLSHTVEPMWNFGFSYLDYYYQFNLKDKPDQSAYPTYTLIYPHYWHMIKSDYIFGDIGVGVPKDES